MSSEGAELNVQAESKLEAPCRGKKKKRKVLWRLSPTETNPQTYGRGGG